VAEVGELVGEVRHVGGQRRWGGHQFGEAGGGASTFPAVT
jgi:hypothetical protein